MTAIIGHRGASADAPENTLEAFGLAWEQGADAIELDVHLTSDRRLVVIHDADTTRTTGFRGKVTDQTSAALGRLDAGSWKDPRWRGATIPLLSEVLAKVPQGKRAFIEIKAGAECLVALKEDLQNCSLDISQTAFLCFDEGVIRAARKAMPDREASWNIDGPWKSPTLPMIIKHALEGGLQGLSFSNKWKLNSRQVRKVKDAGLRVYVWTVDDPQRAATLIEAGVDGIISNVPGRLIGLEQRPDHLSGA